MSAKSTILRGMYGVEPRPKQAKSKYAFYRQQEALRGDVRRRAEQERAKAERRRQELTVLKQGAVT